MIIAQQDLAFEIPDSAASELAAAYLQGAITLGLVALFLFLHRRYRKPYFGWFALAWVVYGLRLAAIISFLTTQRAIWLYWHQVATGWTALALLWAALVFSQQLRWRRRYLTVVLFPPIWSYVAIYRMDNFLLAAGPAVLFLSGATLWTGWTFLRHHRRVGSAAAVGLAGAFLLWSLHHLDYPFLRARGVWNPWGYYLDILFVLAVGAGVLLLVLEEVQRGLAALSSLSGELQHRAPEDELLDALLATTMTLASVRGCAIYLAPGREPGTIVRGAGTCAAWAGRAPAGAAASAIAELAQGTLGGRVAVAGRLSDPADGGAFVAALPIVTEQGLGGALIMVSDARDPFAALDDGFLVALGRQVGVALAGASLYRRLEERTAELERLATRMINLHEAERRHLQRELHDETAQVFSAVRLQIGLLRERAAPELAPRLDRVLRLIDVGIGSIRSVTARLRPSVLDELGLPAALRALVEHFAERSMLRITLPPLDDLPPLGGTEELAVYRAVQEALSNAAQHADATRATIALSMEEGLLTLTVTDNGSGWPPDWSPEAAGRRGHYGLAGMRERFRALGGDVHVGDAAGGGAVIVARFPYVPESPTDG
ncbi:MAG TPA: sensor histidine kinase [Gemmatimonadales bacterium]